MGVWGVSVWGVGVGVVSVWVVSVCGVGVLGVSVGVVSVWGVSVLRSDCLWSEFFVRVWRVAVQILTSFVVFLSDIPSITF